MIIKIKKELEILREGGKKLAAVLAEVAGIAKEGTTTKQLDELAEKLILKNGGKPSFKGYKVYGAPSSYPGTLCVSINEEVVHGIPNDRVLKNGDVVGLDIGMLWPAEALAKGAGLFTDMATTILIGEHNLAKAQVLQDLAQRDGASGAPVKRVSASETESARRLITATKKSLEIGISKVRPGARIGDIGFAIQQHLEKEGFGVVRELVGHGVGRAVHEEPEIPNWGIKGEGDELFEGLVIAIEPMATEGNFKVKVAPDGWTWVTRDGSRSAHFEHTLVVTKNGAEVLTRI